MIGFYALKSGSSQVFGLGSRIELVLSGLRIRLAGVHRHTCIPFARLTAGALTSPTMLRTPNCPRKKSRKEEKSGRDTFYSVR